MVINAVFSQSQDTLSNMVSYDCYAKHIETFISIFYSANCGVILVLGLQSYFYIAVITTTKIIKKTIKQTQTYEYARSTYFAHLRAQLTTK